MITADQLMTESLRGLSQGEVIARVLAAALQAVEPAAAVGRYLRRDGDTLVVAERRYDLARIERVFVVGAGKAGVPMAQAAAEILGDRLSGGVMVVKEGHAENREPRTENRSDKVLGSRFSVLEAAHPIPDRRGVAASEQIAQLLAGTTERDLVIALISGGGSALLTQPADRITLEDIQQLTNLLLRSGASIGEINTLRKHLDRMKGGGLARLAYPAQLLALVLSDVVGSPLDVIASGPTVADPTTFADALAMLERYGITAQAPAAALALLQQGAAGAVEETLKLGDQRLAQVFNQIVASNSLAAEAAIDQATAEGLNSLLLTTYLQGEAREAGRFAAAIGRELVFERRPLARPACLVLGGETTVTVRGQGLGGRNQELALGAVGEIAGLDAVVVVTLATDGGDGPTDAAGAVVTGATKERARALGLDAADFLARNDAYHFFAPLGDLLRPGPTQTNVNDLLFVFAL